MSRRRTAVAANLGLALVSLSLAIAVTEVALRVLESRAPGGKEQRERERYTEYDPLLGWRKTAGAKVSYVRRDYRSQFRINAHGLRGPEHPYAKPAGEIRVLALGDSFVEAFMLDDEQMLTTRFETHLRGLGCDATVINGGSAGYSTDQEYLFYTEQGRRYQPDIVVIFVYHNDIPYLVLDHYNEYSKPLLDFETEPPRVVNAPVPRPLRRAPAVPRPPPAPPTSHLLEFVKGRLENAAPRLYNRAAGWGLWEPLRKLEMNEELRLYYEPEEGHLRPAWSAFTWALISLRDAVVVDGGRLLVAYVPSRMEVTRRHLEQTQARYPLDLSRFRPTVVSERVQSISERIGVGFLDLTPPLADAESLWSPTYYPTDSHWNARGQDVAAAALAKLLTQSWLGCRRGG